MRETFEDMLPIALQVGIGVMDYWYLTYGEIVATIDAYKENEKVRIREVAAFNHSQANLIGMSVARLMDKNAKYPSLKEAFPKIFDDLVEGTLIPQQDPEIMKERLMAFANAHNKK